MAKYVIKQTVLDDDINRADIKKLRADGIIQEVNRQFLHPLGLAIETIVNDDGTEQLGGIWDYRNDPEGIIFGHIEPEKVEKVQKLTSEQHIRRFRELGFVIQLKDIEPDKM